MAQVMEIVSIIIRTLNEAKYLGELLEIIGSQDLKNEFKLEVIVVDSGSSDSTLSIAKSFNCKIINIRRDEFSFGRSLNIGCKNAIGKYLVFISGHCIPSSAEWVFNLIKPIKNNEVQLTYGRQVSGPDSKLSESNIFKKFYPKTSSIPQNHFFFNNANSAVLKDVWEYELFNEELTGLEDMYFAKKVAEDGKKIGYVTEAKVYHLHNESWRQVIRRFERESYALQFIMPEIQISLADVVRYAFYSIMCDLRDAYEKRCFMKNFNEIILYRLCQYWGVYRGNHIHRKISKKQKDKYYYPI